jgi:hypothetical protein
VVFAGGVGAEDLPMELLETTRGRLGDVAGDDRGGGGWGWARGGRGVRCSIARLGGSSSVWRVYAVGKWVVRLCMHA